MAIATELRKTLTETTPFYAVAGAGDLVVEKLRELPERFRTEVVTDPKVIRERIQALPDRTQTFARSQVDRARGIYDDLAARGEKLVKRGDRHDDTTPVAEPPAAPAASRAKTAATGANATKRANAKPRPKPAAETGTEPTTGSGA
ncbi:hypothetical protein [Embleya sp. NPDC059237]|uniref:hypothetical protein n=1 Tax=Embleya sp. NPDC059237 TaxID=3346784 RepID=UPI0036C8D182